MVSSKRRDYLWNTTAGIINAAEAVVMSMVVTRFGLLSDAGVLSLAFAAGNVLMAIGVFGGRMYQASDIRRQYSYRMYMILRFITLGLMIVSLVLFLLYEGYSGPKAQSIVLIAFIYMIEVVENCIWAQYQSIDLLYVGAAMFSTRWIAVIVVFTVIMMITGEMVRALFWGAIAGMVVFVIWLIILAGNGNYDVGRLPEGFGWIREMLGQLFPLFVAGFCSIFIGNIPKFAIDRYMNDEVQACFGFVAMPVFVISLLNQFIYQPTVVKLSQEYHDGDLLVFGQNVRKQMFIVAVIMMLCVVGAAAIGIPVLSILYDTDLSGYWKELVILQFAGGFLALSGYFSVVLTIIRKQKVILAGYLVALILGILILFTTVKAYGTLGASVGYLIVMAILFMYYYIAYISIMRKA